MVTICFICTYITFCLYHLYIMLCAHLELSALADLMGPYGIRYLGEQLTELVSSQVKELKVENMLDTYTIIMYMSTM